MLAILGKIERRGNVDSAGIFFADVLLYTPELTHGGKE